MTLKDFKSIYGKYPADQKLEKIYDVVDCIASARARHAEAICRINQEDATYYNWEEIYMRQRLQFLVESVKKQYNRLETKYSGLEERFLEQGE